MGGAERAFALRFGSAPEIVVRAPGRVNLIGEHTDTSHLPVLPIAIDRCVEVAAASAARPGIEAGSELSPHLVDLDWDSAMEKGPSSQSSGIAAQDPSGLAPYLRGVMRELETLARRGDSQFETETETETGARTRRGARLAVVSDLPATGGLSSSSALTVAMIAALNAVWDLGLDAETIAHTAIRAERHVGVESGGMDQTAIVFARVGHALRIDFAPPARRHVPLHDGLRVIVASSGTLAAKGGGVRDAYNARVVGCRAAAALLIAQVGARPGAETGAGSGTAPRLCDVAETISERDVAALPERIRPSDAAARAGLSREALVTLTASNFDADAPLPVRAYARHVLSEAARVDAFERALTSRDAGALGSLLDASHASLAHDFECSTPALDRLCAVLRGAGAIGARLTGAGFGGYALALCRPDAVAPAIAAAIATTGGPAFEVRPSDGLRVTREER